MADVVATNHGSIWLLLPVTEAANEWIDEHIPDDAQFMGNALAVEWRFVEDVLDGMVGDGLEVES